MVVTLLQGEQVEVSSHAQASKVVTAQIARLGMGSSEWYRTQAGRILVGGVQVAFVSYNGRVWEGREDGTLNHKEIPVAGV